MKLLNEKKGLFFAHDNYIGSGTPDARPGDKVALIMGLCLPMILRDVAGYERQYTVVGPAFVSGYEGPFPGGESFDWIGLV